jgi:hypothetical protein
MARTKRAQTLIEICVARAIRESGGDPSSLMAGVKSVPRGTRVAGYIAQWAMASNEVGKFATTVEYTEHLGIDERTGWRHRAAIHALFSDDEFRVLVDAVRELVRRGERNPLAAEVPVLAA